VGALLPLVGAPSNALDRSPAVGRSADRLVGDWLNSDSDAKKFDVFTFKGDGTYERFQPKSP
jgi:hypothetical protein